MGASSEIIKTVASKFVFIVRCRTGEAIDSVSAICPMLYWGSFFEMCDCEQCYIWKSVKQCQPEQRTAGLLYVY